MFILRVLKTETKSEGLDCQLLWERFDVQLKQPGYQVTWLSKGTRLLGSQIDLGARMTQVAGLITWPVPHCFFECRRTKKSSLICNASQLTRRFVFCCVFGQRTTKILTTEFLIALPALVSRQSMPRFIVYHP